MWLRVCFKVKTLLNNAFKVFTWCSDSKETHAAQLLPEFLNIAQTKYG